MRMMTISRSRPSSVVFQRIVLEWLNQLSANAGAVEQHAIDVDQLAAPAGGIFLHDLGEFGMVLLLDEGNASHGLPCYRDACGHGRAAARHVVRPGHPRLSIARGYKDVDARHKGRA